MFLLDCVLVISLHVFLFSHVASPPTSPRFRVLLALVEYDHPIRGSLCLVWLQKEGMWLRAFLQSTNVSVVSAYDALNQTCSSCASEFSEAFQTLGLELPEHHVF